MSYSQLAPSNTHRVKYVFQLFVLSECVEFQLSEMTVLADSGYHNRALDKMEYFMIIFLFLIETICCDPSSELSR